MEIETIQLNYDTLVAHLSLAQEELKEFEARLPKWNVFVQNGKILPNEKVWGAFWNIDYYSHYDGHTNDPIYKEYEGAVVLRQSEVDELTEFIETAPKWIDTSDKDKKELLSEIDFFPSQTPYPILNELERLCDETYGSKAKFQYNELKIKDRGIRIILEKNLLRFEVINSIELDQNECVDGSFFEFRLTDKSEINGKKITQKESRG